MTYFQRTLYVGGYFTAGMLVINALFADLGAVGAVVLSLVLGGLFTAGGLWAGRKNWTRRY